MGIERRELESLLAALDAAARDNNTVEAVAASWRFSNITDLEEVNSWLRVGVFDGHRAGILKMANVHPRDLAELPGKAAHSAGFAFSIGQLSLSELQNLINAFATVRRLELATANTLVQEKPGVASTPPDDESSGDATG